MKTFFTSDLHLGHKSIIEFCGRPHLSTDHMDQVLIENYNQLVGHDDECYFLGDVSFHKPLIGVPLMRRLKGRKLLVQGNHDKYSVTQYHDAGFVVVSQEIKLRWQGHPLTLSHYPFWPAHPELEESHELRYPERRPEDRGQWLIHGHVHRRWQRSGRQINVGVDVWDFKPVTEQQLASIVAHRTGVLG